MLKILIVDDEPLARARLRGQITDLAAGEIVGEAADGVAALEQVSRLRPDTVLLDIRMPRMDGLEVAQHLSRLDSPPAIIFATAYGDHALAAFEANAVDYLLKPIRNDRLRTAIEKASAISAGQAERARSALEPDARRSHISAMVAGELRVVAVPEVLYCHADQGYVNVVWATGSMLVEESLKTLEEEFEDRFVRIHRNALVALDAVASLARDADGNHVVRLRGLDVRLPVSRRLLAAVRKRLR